MKKTLFIFLLVNWGTVIFAQQEPQFTLYMFNKVAINPASAGVSGAACLTGFGRYQWLGYQDLQGNPISPQTYGVSFDMPVYAIKSGAGLTFQYGKLGAEKNIDVKLHYAYHKVFQKKHMLSAGLSFGILSKSIDYSKLNPAEPDPLLQSNTVEKGTLTDIDLGIHYQIFRKFYAGISVTNLIGSSAEIGAPEFTQARHFYAFSGYDFEIKTNWRNNFVLTPGFLLKAASGAVQLDLNAVLTYNDQFWGGIVYRIENAIGFMAGINYNGLRFGVSYDYTMNRNFANGNRSSIEIILKYCYPIFPGVVKKSGYNTRNL
jgi:type IX secretion system PorP/SprF family membrane protein